MQIRNNRKKSPRRPKGNAEAFPDRANRSQSKSRSPRAGTNGPGNAKRSYERYITLARSAVSNGDEVEIENLYQHAEHFLRLMKKQSAQNKVPE